MFQSGGNLRGTTVSHPKKVRRPTLQAHVGVPEMNPTKVGSANSNLHPAMRLRDEFMEELLPRELRQTALQEG